MKRRKADPEPSPLVLPPSAADNERLGRLRERLADNFSRLFSKVAENELPFVLRLVRQSMSDAGLDPGSVEEPKGLCLNDMSLAEQVYTLDGLVDRVKSMAMSFDAVPGCSGDEGEPHCLDGEGAANAYVLVHLLLEDLRAVAKFYRREYPWEQLLESVLDLELTHERMKMGLLGDESVLELAGAVVAAAGTLVVREVPTEPRPELEVAMSTGDSRESGMSAEESRDVPTVGFASEVSRDAPTEKLADAGAAEDVEGRAKDEEALANAGVTAASVAPTGTASLDAALQETYMALKLMAMRVGGVYVLMTNDLVKKEGHSVELVKRLVESGPEAEAEAFPEKEPGPRVVDRRTWLDKEASDFARLRYVAGLMKDVNAIIEEDVATGAIVETPIAPRSDKDLTEMYRHQLWTKLVVIQTSARVGETAEAESSMRNAFSRAYLRLAVAFQDLELEIFKHKEASA